MASALRFAIVGCGAIAQHHLKALAAVSLRAGAAAITDALPRVNVTAVVDTHTGRAHAFADAVGTAGLGMPAVVDSLDALLAPGRLGDFDAISLLLPHHLHESAAVAALRTGKHVLLEKPMAPTLEACDRIMAAAAASPTDDAVFMVAENSQYWPDIVAVQQLLDDGAIGDIVTASAHYYEALSATPFESEGMQGSSSGSAGGDGSVVDRKPDESEANTWLDWRADLDKCGGGVVLDGGQHWIRPLRMWLGEIAEVVAVTGRPLSEMQGESMAQALLRFESGLTGTFQCTVLPHTGVMAHGHAPWFRVTGTHGEIVIEGAFDGGVTLFNAQHPTGRAILRPGQVGRPCGFLGSFEAELEDFLRAVASRATPGAARHELRAGPEEALGELRTALAIYRSAATGQWEKVWG